ncbi:hypothetical protein CEXT_422261 [Caerostris extrusa]|uniref:Uncharacterized protein n=1 Tax=Caerostris extrusa TaxID=172846 RepID=A0AAV4U9F3_CAEEX|nr:hypothetical protein CEXT_422261 [Caerostris extrusa]
MSSAYLITDFLETNPRVLWTHPESLCCPSQWGEYAISGNMQSSSAEHDVHYLDCQDNILQDEFPEFAQAHSRLSVNQVTVPGVQVSFLAHNYDGTVVSARKATIWL